MNLTYRFEWEGDSCMAFCQELPLAGIGPSAAAALTSLEGCLETYLDCLESAGMMETVLRGYVLL